MRDIIHRQVNWLLKHTIYCPSYPPCPPGLLFVADLRYSNERPRKRSGGHHWSFPFLLPPVTPSIALTHAHTSAPISPRMPFSLALYTAISTPLPLTFCLSVPTTSLPVPVWLFSSISSLSCRSLFLGTCHFSFHISLSPHLFFPSISLPASRLTCHCLSLLIWLSLYSLYLSIALSPTSFFLHFSVCVRMCLCVCQHSPPQWRQGLLG